MDSLPSGTLDLWCAACGTVAAVDVAGAGTSNSLTVNNKLGNLSLRGTWTCATCGGANSFAGSISANQSI